MNYEVMKWWGMITKEKEMASFPIRKEHEDKVLTLFGERRGCIMVHAR